MPKPPSDIAILILAAGASVRMGRPKQLLPWSGASLLSNVIDNALKLKSTDVFVVLGANSDQIVKQIDFKESKPLLHKGWKEGLGSSIAFGVQYLIASSNNYDGVLMILCDQPLIDSEFLQEFINLFNKGSKGIVATTYPDGVGVPVMLHSKYFNELRRLHDDKGAKKIIQDHHEDVELIDSNDRIIDLDTLEDYEQLLQKVFKK